MFEASKKPPGKARHGSGTLILYPKANSGPLANIWRCALSRYPITSHALESKASRSSGIRLERAFCVSDAVPPEIEILRSEATTCSTRETRQEPKLRSGTVRPKNEEATVTELCALLMGILTCPVA